MSSKTIKLSYSYFEPSVDSNKSTIVVIHGLTASKEMINSIIKDLLEITQRKVYAVDLRNHGDSEWNDEFSMSSMVGDILQFLDDHKIEKPVILGHSLGGRLASVLALEHPERLDKIIVEDMTPKSIPQETGDAYKGLLKTIADAVEQVPEGLDLETASAMYMQYVFKNKPEGAMQNLNFEALTKRQDSLAMRMKVKDGKITLKSNMDVLLNSFSKLGMESDLQGCSQVPALFIYGLKSEFNVGDDKNFILKLFPKAQLSGIEASHVMHLEDPENFLKIVKEFLS